MPFRGSAPALQNVLAGQLDIIIDQASSALSMAKSGGVRAYAVTSAARLASAPDIPTATELGYPSLQILGWYVFFAPPKTPPTLIDAWGNELRAVLKLPEVDKKLTEFGLDVETSTPAQFTQRMAADFARWKSILDSIGYKPSN